LPLPTCDLVSAHAPRLDAERLGEPLHRLPRPRAECASLRSIRPRRPRRPRPTRIHGCVRRVRARRATW
jgi:hypothetical protein